MFLSKNFKTFNEEEKASDDKVNMLEARVKHRNDPEAFFKTLVPESDIEKYFKFLDLIRETAGTKKLPKVEAFWKENSSTKGSSNSKPLRYEVYFKYLISRLSEETDTKTRRVLLDELNEHFLYENVKPSIVVSNTQMTASTNSEHAQACPIKIVKNHQQDIDCKLQEAKSSLQNLLYLRVHREILKPLPHDEILLLAKSSSEAGSYLEKILPDPAMPADKFNKLILSYIKVVSKWTRNITISTKVLQAATSTQIEAILPLFTPLPQNMLTEWIWKRFELHSLLPQTSLSLDLLTQIQQSLRALPEPLLSSLSVRQTSSWVSLMIMFPPESTTTQLPALLTHLESHVEVIGLRSLPWISTQYKHNNQDNEQPCECPFPTVSTSVVVNKIYQTLVAAALAHESRSVVEQYFHSLILNKEVARSRLLAGEQVEGVAQIFTEIELNTLRDSHVLEFSKDNPVSFKKQEPVVIAVHLKNIRSMQVSLFQLNTANCYAKSQEIQMVDLSGLIPSEQKTVKYFQPAMHKHLESFDFPTIASSLRGLFIVELVGEGLCSRTIIKKGGLSLLPISENTCHQFAVLSEEATVCPHAKIEVAGKSFTADENGLIDIPFSTRGITGSGVISFENFHEPFTIELPPIKWELDFGAIYNEEALCGGTNLDLIVRPRLFANNISVSLSTLSKVQLLVTSATNESILTARHFEPSLQALDEIVLSYKIPLQTIWIKVTLTGEIQGVTVTATKNVKSAQPHENERTVSVSLDKAPDNNFVLKAQGLSGEPVVGLEIKTNSMMYSSDEIYTEDYLTDSQGQLCLGQLEGIVKFAIQYSDCGRNVNQNFPLLIDSRLSGIPDYLDIVEGEDLRLPKLQGIEGVQYRLSRTDASFTNIYTDCSKQIELESDLLYCTRLTEGHYLFSAIYQHTIKKIQLNVISGRRWDRSSEIVIQEGTAQRLQHQSNYLTIDSVKYNQETHELNLRVFSNQIDAVKVNVLGFQSCPNTLGEVLESLNRLTTKAQLTKYTIRQNCNLYLSEKELGDELKYVVERQQRSTFPGTNLDKPSGLLKPKLNRKTQVDTQRTVGASCFKMSVGSLPGPQAVKVPSVTRKQHSCEFKMDFLNNKWLGRRGTVITCEPDIDGTVAANCMALEGFSCWLLLVQDGNNFVHQLYYPPRETVIMEPPKNLGLSKSRNTGSVYLHSRTAGVLHPNNELVFGDRNALSLNTLNDFSEFFDLCLAFQPDLLQFGFMKDWGNYSFEEKQSYYEKFCGHELHLFLAQKDPEFFKKLVLPHLKNKLTRSVVDQCLLDPSSLSSSDFLTLGTLSTLAPWEICLLSQASAKQGDRLTHMKLSNLLRLRAEASQHSYKNNFDTVLHFSTTKTGAVCSDDALTQSAPAALQSGSAKYQMKAQTLIKNREVNPGTPIMYGSKQKPTVYIEVSQTYEYSERDYYLEAKNEYSEAAFGFWADMAEAVDKKPESQALLSEKFIQGTGRNTLELLMFCIFQGFPLNSNPKQVPESGLVMVISEGSQTKLRNISGNSCIYFAKELIENKSETNMHPDSSKVFLSYTYCPQRQKTIYQTSFAEAGLFQIGVVYCCRVVVVSTSSNPMDLDLQAEIPQGSIPVKSGSYFHSKPFTLDKYGNFTFEFSFYFPNEGDFSHFAPTLVSNGQFMKHGTLAFNRKTLSVVKLLPCAKITTHECSFNDLVKQIQDSSGSIIYEAFQQLRTNILQQLRKSNPFDKSTTDLSLLAPACAIDKAFFSSIINILRDKAIYDKRIWVFSILHDDMDSIRELLAQRFPSTQSIKMHDFEIYHMNTNLLKINGFRTKSYDPVVNSRAHFVEGRSHAITNKEFLDTYMHFLKYLQDKHQIDDTDKLLFAEYLLTQDRFNEASLLVETIKHTSDIVNMQLDYTRVYCHMCQPDPPVQNLIEICAKYFTYPIVRWRNLFVEAANILYEFQNKEGKNQIAPTDENSVAYRNCKNAQNQETVKASINQATLSISTSNVEQVTLKFYKIDVESKFSIDPFNKQTDSTFGYVAPNLRKQVLVVSKYQPSNNKDSLTEMVLTEFDIPTELVDFNLCVQVSTGRKSLFLNYLPSSYQVLTLKEKDLIQVLSKKGQPVSQAYVKVFSCGINGAEKYHKDGYTDYLGFFDYLTLNLENPNLIKEFSVLILGPLSNPGSQILRIIHTMNEQLTNKASRMEDIVVEQKLKALQRHLVQFGQSTEQPNQPETIIKSATKTAKYAVMFN